MAADLNVDNYTIPELLAIVELDDPTSSEIIDTTNNFIERFDNEGNKNMSIFFQNIQDKLFQYVDDI